MWVTKCVGTVQCIYTTPSFCYRAAKCMATVTHFVNRLHNALHWTCVLLQFPRILLPVVTTNWLPTRILPTIQVSILQPGWDKKKSSISISDAFSSDNGQRRVKNVYGIFGWVRLKPICSATETSLYIEVLHGASKDIIMLNDKRIRKVLIRLKCAVWSAPLLFTTDMVRFFSGRGPGPEVINFFHTHLNWA